MLVELKQCLEALSPNVIVPLVGGKHYTGAPACSDDDEARMCRKAVSQFFNLMGAFEVSDASGPISK